MIELSSIALCDVEDIYTYMAQQDIDPSNYSLTENQWKMLINSTSTKIQNISNRNFKETVYTSYFDGEGGKLLFVDQFPIVEGETFTISLVNVDESSVTLLDSDTYKINYILGEIYRPSGFIAGNGNYKVTFTAGYAENSNELNNLKVICAEFVLKEANRAVVDTSVKSDKTGDVQVTYFSSAENDKNLRVELSPYINNF